MNEEKIILTLPQLYSHYTNNLLINPRSKCLGPHFHTAIEIVFVEKGTLLCHIENKVVRIPKNSFLIVGSNVIHHLTCDNTSAEICYLQVDVQKIMELIYKDLSDIPFIFDPSLKKYLLLKNCDLNFPLLIGIFRELQAKKPYFELNFMGNLLHLISYLQGEEIICDFKRLLKDLSVKKIYPAIKYINDHLAEKISLEGMCEMLCLDKYYLCKLFKKSTGMTFTQYLTRMRIQYAEHLLTATDKSVTDIALECGFSTVQYFNTVFNKVKGCSPRAFKASYF